ncbi:MAG: T9SS type A sorting domain-containing protein [Bacteroidia bacterium]|nr:T9SS type A sorting domain-containing protein [Bacteroidia bacterium]MCF8428367.1 T9SS type A sorting domain-containing protein [Bacteroidia bacterium]MCF8447298.1 T9SS type A sorting domain-containing protein [Bacteroidia bacterium]
MQKLLKNHPLILLLFWLVQTEQVISQTIALSTTDGFSICSDSSLWGWGTNYYGEIGDSSTLPSFTPKMAGISKLGKVKAIATFSACTVVILADGTVWSWGANTIGQLGVNSTTSSLVPQQVHGPNNVGYLDSAKSLCANYQSVFVLREDGTVWGWGWNGTGVLGDGSYSNTKKFPGQVIKSDFTPLTGIVKISSSAEHVLALTEAGSVYTWGKDYNGELGQGSNPGSFFLTAVPVVSESGSGILSNVKSVAAGGQFSLALKQDGSVWSWGANANGKLGNPSSSGTSKPIQVKGLDGSTPLTGIIEIAVGKQHALALTNSGTLLAWGDNSYGQLSASFLGLYSPKPILVKGLNGITKIVASNESSAAEMNGKELLIWGNNSLGNIGNTTKTSIEIIPKKVLNEQGGFPFVPIKSNEVGDDHQLTLNADGTIYAWGNYSSNVLIGSNFEKAFLPNKIYDSLGINYLNGIKQISAGKLHNLALSSNGMVYGWGSTYGYVMGNPGFSQTAKAFAIKNANGSRITNVRMVKAGPKTSVYLFNDSTVSFNGNILYNSLNSLNYTYPTVFKDTSGTDALKSVISIATGQDCIFALKADGHVYAYGNNNLGQLGTGDKEWKLYPVLVKNPDGTGYLNDIVEIAVKVSSVFALNKFGQVYAWGLNTKGQLGVGDTSSSLLPRFVLNSTGTAPLSNIVAIGPGEYHCLALDKDSTAWAWGWNVYGETGDLTTIQRYLPVKPKFANGEIMKHLLSVQAGTLISTFLTNKNELFSCGSNIYAELGVRKTLGEDMPQLTQLPCRSTAPIAQFYAEKTKGCGNTCIQFFDSSQHVPGTYFWEIIGANPSSSEEANPLFCFNQAGIYSVKLKVLNFLGTDSIEKNSYIEIGNFPKAAFTLSTHNPSRTLTTTNLSTFATSYLWKFGDGNTDTSLAPQHVFVSDGKYNVCLSASNWCGVKDTCAEVQILNVGLNQNTASKSFVSVFPNPSKGMVFLSKEVEYLAVYDLQGKLLLEKKDTKDFSLEGLNDGLYILKVQTKNQHNTYRVRKSTE